MDLHQKTIARFSHDHDSGTVSKAAERKTLLVALLTAVTMGIEIVAGTMTGSMGLLADGWHMGTHAFALSISFLAYVLARRHRRSQRFSFGTGKFAVLGGYTSALLLGATALWMLVESVHRIISPIQIAFTEAIVVAIFGLVVNVLSILILNQSGDHDHSHGESSGHHDHHQDHNYRAAYMHVIADALTSVFALVALLAGRYIGWSFLDPVMGIVGGVLILRWAYKLIVSSGKVLLDGGIEAELRETIRSRLESDDESRVADLHVWHLGSNELSIVASVVSGQPREPEEYRLRLEDIPNLAHLSIELNPCDDTECICARSKLSA